MTNDQINDCFTALGRAFAERRNLEPKLENLRRQIASAGKALSTLASNPLHEESTKIVEGDCEPAKDWMEYKQGLNRLSELNKILT